MRGDIAVLQFLNLVILIDAIEKAQNDPEVKNFILDTSTNGGGSTDIVVFITSMFTNKPDLYYQNVLTGQRMKSSYDVDRNLDGKFDEKDKDVKLNMNIGVLISSCCVLFNPSADGFGYRYSTHHSRLNNLKGQNIDEGIEPDYQLETGEFFDIAKVGKLIEQFYAK